MIRIVPSSVIIAVLALLISTQAFECAAALPVPLQPLAQQAHQIENALATSVAIKEVAAETGFKSVQHMTTLFRKAFGQTPARYRKGGPWQSADLKDSHKVGLRKPLRTRRLCLW